MRGGTKRGQVMTDSPQAGLQNFEHGSVRILVLEDDEDMREALRDVLAEEGFSVVAVAKGAEAVALAAKETFDLMVSDVRMEGLSGLDAIEKIRENQPDLGSLVVSGWASEEDTLRAVRLNVGGYLKKPFSMNSFLDAVKGLVRKQEERKQRQKQQESLTTVLDWALSSLARVSDLGRKPHEGSLVKSGQAASWMARQLGFARERQAQARWWTLAEGLRDLPEVELPDWLAQADQLDSVRFLQPDERLQLLARASLELQRALQSNDDEVMARLKPLDLPDELLAVCQKYQEQRYLQSGQAGLAPEVQAGLEGAETVERSLIALAKTLEESGDLKSASEAYREVYRKYDMRSGTEPTLELLQALQGAAYLAYLTNEPAASEELMQRCLHFSRQFGPLAQCQAQLRLAVLRHLGLVRQNSAATADSVQGLLNGLEQLATSQSKLQLRFGQALSYLLMSCWGDARGSQFLAQSIGVVCKSSNLGDFGSSKEWTVPVLLLACGQATGELTRPAYELCLEFPKEIVRALQRAEVTPAGWSAFGKFLGESKRVVPLEIRSALDPYLPEQALNSTAASVAADVPLLRIFSLGFFELHVGSEKVGEAAWKSQKCKALLAMLCGRPGKGVHEDVILDAFWPDDVRRGKRNLYAALSHVRRALRQDKPENESWDPIVRDKEYLSFNWDLKHWLDLALVEAAFAKAEQADQLGHSEEAITAYRRVCQLSRGPYLEGLYFDWVIERRRELDGQLLTALTRLAYLLCQSRAYQEAMEHAQRATLLAPDDQNSHLLKMRCYLGLGQPEAVLRHFQNFERYLRQEFGFEPNTELVELCVRAKHGLPDKAQ